MRRAAWAGLLRCTIGAARAQDLTLSQRVDALQRLQTRVAAGDKAAYAAEPGQLRAIGAAISTATPDNWKQKSEAVAAIAYLLSGGQPRDVSKALQSGNLPKAEETLMRGALLYAQGREREAGALIGALDPRRLDARIAGQVAYALGVIAISGDAGKALELFDLARVLAPGGLVEEASLRREILLGGERRDVDRVAMLARQYLTRFGGSIYAVNFMQGFAATVVRLNLIDSLASFDKFRRSARSMSPENRRGFMLAVARSELDNGKFDVAASAARVALDETAGADADATRGQLYQATARLLGGESDEGLAQLGAIAATKLGASDRLLLAAVKDIAAHLHEAAEPGSSAPAPSDSDPAVKTIENAQAAMERTLKLADAGGHP